MLEQVDCFLKKWYRELAFVIGLGATAGSLYTSQILEWQVCGLCWFQRVLMYPIPLILGAAIFSEARKIKFSILPLTLIGFFASIYHYISIVVDPTRACGFYLPCTMKYQFFIGFTLRPRHLPLLSAIAFGLIAVLIWKYEE
jgi:disulfide bond formation protein DsbB